MSFPEDEVEELKTLFPDAKMASEGGLSYILLPNVSLPEGCSPTQATLLFCPMPREGYPSRLFFPQQIQSKAAPNWNSRGIQILSQNWWAYSWKINHAGLRLAQAVTYHLSALK